ncbi:MAG TPA: cytochrome c [Pseudolabrys sp.]|jgi:cytochrome c556
MKKLIAVSLGVVALVSAAFSHEGHEHATGVVRERMELMTDMGKRLLAISKRLRANKELDRILPDARAIKNASDKITSQFPPGSTQSPTAAKPAVWQQWDDFNEKAKKLQTEAEKLATMNPSDGDALRKQFRVVGFACDACHEQYRIPKENEKR